ncbi:MAG: hypothetical protein SGBAC_003145 [Bacillariaceae sp.]
MTSSTADYWKCLQEAVDSVDYGMTEEEKTQTEEILNELSQEEQEALADKFMTLRHLRAEKGNVKKAIAAMQRTLKWRKEFQVQDLKQCLQQQQQQQEEHVDQQEPIDEKKEEDHKASLNALASVIRTENETGKSYVRGYDKDGRAILYMRPAKENTNHEEGNMRNLVYHMEKSIACSSKNGQSEICIVIDYDGFQLRHAPPTSTSKYTLDVLQKHYPERLYRAYICNPPWIFRGFWKVIGPFVDPVTKQKLQFCTSASDFEKVVSDMGGSEKAAPYLEECAGGSIKPTDFDTTAYLSLPFNMSLGE